MNSVVYKKASTNEELHQIIKLQHANISASISEEEKQKEGFVTVQHSLTLLKAMNDKCPHIIAKSENKVVGYALSMVKSFKDEIEVLKPMFINIEKNVPDTLKYIVMGQICIDKAFRKRGVFRGLYSKMNEEMKKDYDAIITEVDETNLRSLHAHYAIGFKILYSYRSKKQDWKILKWDI
ncbi:GNAT family N-acetyltransferase [Flaviramulus sp. BrNp1-15]|uniref:GNAT family N-acetyltransferase n=1 Tax=Flaviramulus sp. BrNp1-15 TaxID=2916754 RepID=UPI001EE7D450|nr:GNAT family N-acetyltransferase [Flaviramulus sp. BrNp1-15]ULC59901.1 GNAT family N-acetyltransferase [Flaviramulus sp. BrNp1-15]